MFAVGMCACVQMMHFCDIQDAAAAAVTPTPSAPQTGRIPSITFRHGLRGKLLDIALNKFVCFCVFLMYLEAPKQQQSSSKDRIAASPYAKKLAREMGINLDAINTASGYKGRVVASDVIKASQEKPATKSAESKQSVSTPPKPVIISSDRSYEDVPISVMREIIGQRLRFCVFKLTCSRSE